MIANAARISVDSLYNRARYESYRYKTRFVVDRKFVDKHGHVQAGVTLHVNKRGHVLAGVTLKKMSTVVRVTN